MLIKHLFVLNLFLVTRLVWAKDRCEPYFANDCFTAVHKDLAYFLNINNNNVTRNITNGHLESLCNAIDDALNCTSDVIDVDCSVEEGKLKFDKWNGAFVQTYYELCDYKGNYDKVFLREILYGLKCWNATHFFQCLQTTANLTSIGQLIAIDVNKNECDVLYQTFDMCRQKQLELTKYYCTQSQTTEAVLIVHHLFEVFMDSSHCRHYYNSNAIQNIFGNDSHFRLFFSIVFVFFNHSFVI